MSQEHSTRAHALLSASGASRWLACTPSPRLEEQIADVGTSYADEGTLAHEMAEVMLRRVLGKMSQAEAREAFARIEASEHYTDEMEDAVTGYVTYVVEQFGEAKRLSPDGHALLIEQRIDLTRYIEGGFGTNDAIIIADGTMEVIDLKYGKGVPVFATDNPQLKLYGLGALWANELSYDIHTVRLSIVQPRLDSISTWEIDVEDLRGWGEQVVVPRARMAYAGQGELVPGDHCRFCKVKPRCRALAELTQSVARHEFKPAHLLTDDEVIEAHAKSGAISDWLDSVNEHMLSEALSGKQWTGYKLVEGRSVRRWSDDELAKRLLLRQGLAEEQITTVKLKGIGDIEKLVGKTKFNDVVGQAVVKPAGKPALVPDSDKRPALSLSAASDFGQDIDENP